MSRALRDWADLNGDGRADIITREVRANERGYHAGGHRYEPIRLLVNLNLEGDPPRFTAPIIYPVGSYERCYSCIFDHDLKVGDLNEARAFMETGFGGRFATGKTFTIYCGGTRCVHLPATP